MAGHPPTRGCFGEERNLPCVSLERRIPLRLEAEPLRRPDLVRWAGKKCLPGQTHPRACDGDRRTCGPVTGTGGWGRMGLGAAQSRECHCRLHTDEGRSEWGPHHKHFSHRCWCAGRGRPPCGGSWTHCSTLAMGRGEPGQALGQGRLLLRRLFEGNGLTSETGKAELECM